MNQPNSNAPPPQPETNAVSLPQGLQRLSGELGVSFVPVEGGSVVTAETYQLMTEISKMANTPDELVNGVTQTPAVENLQPKIIRKAHHPSPEQIAAYSNGVVPNYVTSQDNQGFMMSPGVSNTPTSGSAALMTVPNGVPAMTQLGFKPQYTPPPPQSTSATFKELITQPAYLLILGMMTMMLSVLIMLYLKGSTGARSDQSYLNRVDEQSQAVLDLAEVAARQRTTCISFNCAGVGQVQEVESTSVPANNNVDPELQLAQRYISQWRGEGKSDAEIREYIEWQRTNNSEQLPESSQLAAAYQASK